MSLETDVTLKYIYSASLARRVSFL